MKYKITAALLACFMLLASLSACGTNKENPDDTKSNIPVLTPGNNDPVEDPIDSTNTGSESTEDPAVTTTAATTTAATTTAATTTAATTTAATTTAATTTAAVTTAAPTFTECNDTVYVIATALNLRTSPEVKADNIHTQAKQGEALTRTGYNENWCRVVIDGKEYYASATYLTTENPNAELEFTVRYETVYVTADSLYIREAPSSAGTIVDTVTKGTELIRIGYHEDWSKVMYKDKLLYCGTKYLSLENPLTVETTVPAVG